MRSFIIFALAIIIYGVSVFGGFVQDDRRVILEDSNLGKVDGVMESWIGPYYKGSPRSGAYRPLTSLSLSVDALIFGVRPGGFRLVNVLLYGLLGVLVYELLKKIIDDERWAFWGTLLYVSLPIHAEAVSNIVGRGELLAGIMVLASLIFAIDGKWSWGILFYFLALSSKESAIVWAVPLLLMMKSERNKEKKIGLVMILVIGLVGYCLIRWGVLGGGMLGDKATLVENPLKFVDARQRIMAAIGLIAFGVWKTIFPLHLSYDYSFNQLKLTEFTSFWFGLGLLLIGLSVWMLTRRNRVLNWGMAFLWLPLLVTGNILKPIGTIFGERLWLLPSLGVVLVGLWGIKKIKIEKVLVLLVMLVVLWGGSAFLRSLDWLSEERLFIHDGKYITGSVLAQSNAAAMCIQRGDLKQAKVYLDRGESIYPTYPELMNNWGMYYWRSGDLETARVRFEKCLDFQPKYWLCQSNLENLKKSIR